MKALLFAILLTLFIPLFSSAQDTVSYRPAYGTTKYHGTIPCIYGKNNLFIYLNQSHIKDGKTVLYFSMGHGELYHLNATNLSGMLTANKESDLLIIHANKQKVYSRLWFGAGLTVFLADMFIAASHPLDTTTHFEIPAYISLGCLIPSLVCVIRKNQAVRKAVRLYNGFDTHHFR